MGQAFSQVNLPNLCSGRIDGRDAFQAALCFKDHISSPTNLSTKHTNNSSVIGHGMTPKQLAICSESKEVQVLMSSLVA